ncbi:uncharacterized protein LOC115967075 [Quercus lobata]|uniref:uncharacterized protein LOC115967075 n=1 Tax=Quercus lobata TaxID=97700 RepID=UPI001247B05F|nr:uncharacterized protein LOC115967075 [Quercus lobata]
MHDQVENNKLEKEQRSQIPLPPPPPGRGIPISPFRRQEGSDSSHSTNSIDVKRRKVTMNTTLEKAFQNNARHDLDSRIVRMFYTSELPFNFAKNPLYRSSYAFAATYSIPSYLPPGYNALRTTLLQKERAHVERLLKPIKDSWLENGVSIVSDGWSDPQRKPLINIMAVLDGGSVFIKAIDGSGEFKDKHYIAGGLKDAIKEIGYEKVIQVITDNANVMKSAGALIEGEYPKIFWTPCVVHTLNLVLKNICAAKNTEKNEVTYEECSWITRVVDDASFIRVFIMNHSMRLAMFNEFCPLKLLQVVDTRFASVVVMLKMLKLIKRFLQAMAISDQWASYKKDDVGKAQKVKDMILSDLWWDNIDYIFKFTAPIYDMLRIADTDKPCLHLVYEMWDSMIEKVKAVTYLYEGLEDDHYSSFWGVVSYSIEWLSENPKRIPPHRDHEISIERSKCLERYFEDENDLMVVKFEFAKFSGGGFPSPNALTDRHNEEYIHTTTKMWDIAEDSWNESDMHEGAGILENAALTLDEPELKAIVIGNVNTSATTSESEVRSEAIDLEDDNFCV